MPEVIASPASDVKPEVKSIAITPEQFVAQRVAAQQARSTPKKEESKPEPVVKAEPEEKPKEVKVEAPKEDATKTAEEEAKGKDVLSQVSLSELTDEDIAELAQKGKSGLLRRVAELTAKRKLAEDRAAQLEAQLAAQQQQHPFPLKDSEPTIPPEIASLTTPEAIQAKFKQSEEVIEWAEAVLDAAEGLDASADITSVGDKRYTKAEIKEYLRSARKVKEKFLPAQVRELQAKVQRAAVSEAVMVQTRKEMPWLEGEDNDTRKKYEAMVADPRFAKMAEAVPDLAPYLPNLIAHAANSMYGRKSLSLEPTPKSSPKINPPSSPSTAAAESERAEPAEEKDVKVAANRFRETGKPDDYIALRTAQLNKRKRLK